MCRNLLKYALPQNCKYLIQKNMKKENSDQIKMTERTITQLQVLIFLLGQALLLVFIARKRAVQLFLCESGFFFFYQTIANFIYFHNSVNTKLETNILFHCSAALFCMPGFYGSFDYPVYIFWSLAKSVFFSHENFWF